MMQWLTINKWSEWKAEITLATFRLVGLWYVGDAVVQDTRISKISLSDMKIVIQGRTQMIIYGSKTLFSRMLGSHPKSFGSY